MNSKLKVGDIVEGTHGPMRLIEDFLPKPEALALALRSEPKTEKVTIILDKETVDFFRNKAKELDAPYQRMIRELLKGYVTLQQEQA